MALIQLTKNQCAVVDDELFEQLNSYRWYASGHKGKEYAARREKSGNRALIYMHHQVMAVVGKARAGLHVDHIDGNRLNNRRANLRLVTPSENQTNSIRVGMQKGIGVDRTHGTYKAYINRPGEKRINVGTYVTKAEAIQARLVALAKQ